MEAGRVWRRWSAEDDALLTRMVADGAERAAVSAALRRSVATVKARMHKLGLAYAPEVVRARRQAVAARLNSDPAHLARRAAGISAAWTPERRQRTSERCIRLRLWESGQAKLAQNPEALARRKAAAVAHLKAYHAQRMAWCPERHRADYHALAAELRSAAKARKIIRKRIVAEALAARNAERARAKMAWCPEAYLGLYRQLTRGRGLKAADAKARVLAQVAADRAEAKRRMRPLEPFEALLARVAAGKVTLTERVPVWRPPTHVPGAGTSLAGAQGMAL